MTKKSSRSWPRANSKGAMVMDAHRRTYHQGACPVTDCYRDSLIYVGFVEVLRDTHSAAASSHGGALCFVCARMLASPQTAAMFPSFSCEGDSLARSLARGTLALLFWRGTPSRSRGWGSRARAREQNPARSSRRLVRYAGSPPGRWNTARLSPRRTGTSCDSPVTTVNPVDHAGWPSVNPGTGVASTGDATGRRGLSPCPFVTTRICRR